MSGYQDSNLGPPAPKALFIGFDSFLFIFIYFDYQLIINKLFRYYLFHIDLFCLFAWTNAWTKMELL